VTKRAGSTKYVRIALVVQMLLLGVIVGEVHQRSRTPNVPSPVGPHSPMPPPVPTDRLQTRLSDLEFNGAALSDVLWYLAYRSGENLGADWQELEQDAGILPTAPISLRMKRPTLASALDEICRQLHPKAPFSATYGESGGGILVVGAAASANDVSVPNIASVFDVHDLFGAPAKVQLPPQLPWYELPKDIEARGDIRELADVLKTLQPDTPIIAFGTKLIVLGTSQTAGRVKLALDAIRHPVPLVNEEDLHADSGSLGPLRILMRKEIADPLLEHWKKLYGNQVTFRTLGEASGSPDDPVVVSVSGISSDDLAGNTHGVFEFPYLYIAPGEVDEFARVRRVKLEDGPRAYDVASILADSRRWMPTFFSSGGQGALTLKQKQDVLAEFIYECDHDPWSSEAAESGTIVFWNGLLIVRQDPVVQRHIAKFLEHLQRTGRPFDPPPDQ
jgi:hypothetical protein